ncbi:putative ATPase [Vulcanisaeta moutnovskia 768-28]|uniref:ATPase n=1 Tax=Vulcanisaeta moutnovskia (strain 768-28) TaxID=985053 RepID=F0QT68_VULM7|nr:ATP-binding protein [Vulcanisaeta moutnovskia]ADY01657.1 putative ATPase [Vulcanisaeta moutnovskia 768-28]
MANEVGFIVNVESPLVYIVSIKRNSGVNRYDYVYIPMRDYVNDKEVSVNVLGQILWIRREPYRIGVDGYVADVLEDMPRDSIVEVVQARVMVLGYKYGDKIYMPRTTPAVGTPVYLADTSMVSEFVKVDPKRALCIGRLSLRSDVPYCIDMNGLRRHLAIIASTGSGKTWSSVILIEELLRKGATILVIDPHGEYVHIKNSISKLGPQFLDKVVIITASEGNIGDLRYKINAMRVRPDVLADVAGVPRGASKIRYVIYLVHSLTRIIVKYSGIKRLGTLDTMIKIINDVLDHGTNVNIERVIRHLNVSLNDEGRRKAEKILNELKDLIDSKTKKSLLVSARVYLRRLRRIGLYTHWSLPLGEVLRPGSVTIMNLAGLSDEVQDHVVYHILSRVFRARVNQVRNLPGPKYPFPLVIILEEAHRFAQPRSIGSTLSLGIISRIAGEGRKFGVYLVVITQRPSKVDPDVLSQCNSQIILRLVNQRDIMAVLSASEVLNEELGRLIPMLDVGEGIVVGPVTPLPLVIRLRDRILDYGGSDIDLSEAWTIQSDLNIEELRREVEKALSTKVSARNVLEAVPLINEVSDVDMDTGVLSGRVSDAHVEVRLNENSWSCEVCGASYEPCPHVIALTAKAIKDGLLRVD